jgi:hypothetical protein
MWYPNCVYKESGERIGSTELASARRTCSASLAMMGGRHRWRGELQRRRGSTAKKGGRMAVKVVMLLMSDWGESGDGRQGMETHRVVVMMATAPNNVIE